MQVKGQKPRAKRQNVEGEADHVAEAGRCGSRTFQRLNVSAAREAMTRAKDSSWSLGAAASEALQIADRRFPTAGTAASVPALNQ